MILIQLTKILNPEGRNKINVDFRTEYPRLQFVRKDWICLNGVWDFTIDR